MLRLLPKFVRGILGDSDQANQANKVIPMPEEEDKAALVARRKENLEIFVKQQKEMLKLEIKASSEQSIEEKRELGDSFKVRILSKAAVQYGGVKVKLKPTSKTKRLPTLRKGAMVGFFLDNGDDDEMLDGVMVSFRKDILEVHVQESPDYFKQGEIGELVKLTDEETYKQYAKALSGISSLKDNPLQDIIFGVKKPSIQVDIGSKLSFFNKNLDESQRKAVEFSLKQKELALLHGPPGTGKTTTIVEIIRQVQKISLPSVIYNLLHSPALAFLTFRQNTTTNILDKQKLY